MRSAIREVLETIILTLIIFLLVRAVVQNFKVEGRSMEPNLETGQYLLINKASYWHVAAQSIERLIPGHQDLGNDLVYVFGQPHRGDVIVFRYPKDPSRDFIKRVIALPGETVQIKDGKVLVNDRPLDESYVLDRPNYFVDREVVPANNFFVLGDNRNNSLDSHVWGMVPVENIIGKAWLTYWPMEKWGLLQSGGLSKQAAR